MLEEWKALDATGNAKAGAVYENEEDRYGANGCTRRMCLYILYR